MRREVFWLVAMVLVAGACGVECAEAQQLIDPAPVDEGPELASDLPLPEHSMVVEQPARDNSRAFFGVTFDPQVRSSAVARSVSAGSPADQAGVLAGDMIVSLNGAKIASYDDVLQAIGRLKPGGVLDVEISRRVSVRARAVLEGAPVGVEHTTGYRAEAEVLPPPAGFQSQPPVLRPPLNRAPTGRVPANINAPRPRQNNAAPQNRNPNVNRDGNANRSNNANDRDRDNRGRGGYFRRRG